MTDPDGPGRPQPPAWATRFLGWVLPPEDRGAVVAEMAELFRIRRDRDGEGTARRWYRRQALIFAWTLTLERVRKGKGKADGRSAAVARTTLLRLRIDEHGTTRGGTMGSWIGDARQGLRRLRRAPVFTAVAVLTVAVGIGAFTSVFSVVESVLLKPLPYEEPDELVYIWRDYSAWFPLDRGWLGGPDVVYLREHDRVFEGVVGIRTGRMNLTGRPGTEPAEVGVMLTSASFFRVLGVEPLLGRGFLSGEDEPGADPVVVLGHDLWRGRYGGDPGVVGSRIYLDGDPALVVGVAPSDFRFVKHGSESRAVGADLYLPLTLDLADQEPGAGILAGLARVRDGVSPGRLDQALAAVAGRLDEEAFGNRGFRLQAVSLEEDLVSPVRPALLALAGSAGFLLLILAANLASLLLGRSATRRRELAVRAALGAGRGRLVGSVLGEALLLAGAGGVLGLVLAYWGTGAIVALAPADLPRLADVGIDGVVVVVGLGISLLMGLGAGLGPALRLAGRGPVSGLSEGAARSGSSRGGARARSGLVVAQVALSLMLLVGGGLLARAFADLVRVDPGFDPQEAVTFRVPLDPARYGDSAAVAGFEEDYRTRLAGLPGVAAAGSVTGLPLLKGASQTGVSFPGAPGNTGDPEEDQAFVDHMRASPGYVEAAGLRLLAGRSFREGDGLTGDSTGVAIIDDVLARRFFPGGGAVGSRMRGFGLDLTILGVVDQPRLYEVHADSRGQVYRPMAMVPDDSPYFVIRTDTGRDPVTLVPPARRVLRELDPALPFTDVATLGEIVRASTGQQRLSLILVAGFALGALLLATLGIYGVVANGVVRRTREMGIRMALGAERGRVVRMVLSQGLRLALAGAGIGLVGAVATSRTLEGVVVGVNAGDLPVYVVTALTVVLVATVASWIPARRATRIDPARVLRQE